MSDTPDLSRIVNLILDNPRLVEEISRMAKNDNASMPTDAEIKPAEEPAAESVTASIGFGGDYSSKDERRGVLISALKPYLSESRAKAIDSMMSVAKALEIIKQR